jgi:hypothetical protein
MNARRWLSSLSVVLTVLTVLMLATRLTHAQEPKPPGGSGELGESEEWRSPKDPDNVDGMTDFNGDDYADLAIGVPYENVSSVTDAGSVSVVYGTSTGLSGTADEYWQQNYLDGSDAGAYEYFGRALAVGDFDGDDYYDLAIGVSHEDVGSANQAGAVNIIYGSSAGGLDVADNQYWNQDEAGMGGAAEENDHLGWALATGDFNGDGYDDLAIGVPDEDIGSVVDAGGVMVLYGSDVGLNASGTVWNQEAGAETGDQYGKALAAGDFDNDGYYDLAVGIPSEDLGSILNAGAVEIYYGSTSGLTTRVSNDFWHQDRSGVADTADANDYFGSTLTVGDFDGDGYADLAVGVPYEDVGSPAVVNAGAVNVLYGSDNGITSSGSDYWHQDSTGIGSLSEDDDRFGFALTAGDFDGDSYVDLAVGVPYEHWNDPDTGIVQVLYGTADGISTVGDQLWRQDTTDIQGGEEADDRFGYALAAGDFDGDDYVDLAIGVPYESIGTTEQAGAVHALYGSVMGLTATGNQLWYQGNNGLQGAPETGDRFGWSLAAIQVIMPYEVNLPIIFND